ncbi:MAG: hypothetical protein AAGH15_18650 [Myxococcota bacterium]
MRQLVVLCSFLAPVALARAQPADAPAAPVEDEGDPPEADAEEAPLRFDLNAEYRFRAQLNRDYRLPGEGDVPGRLGQGVHGLQWLRLTGRMFVEERFELVGQMDLFDGVLLGDAAEAIEADGGVRDDRDPLGRDAFDPRWLYVDGETPFARLRAGLVPSHWGLGLLANDGTHERPFREYRFGNRNVRFELDAPLGPEHLPLRAMVALDLVYSDPFAELRDGQRALQAVTALSWDGGEHRCAGIYYVFRRQREDAPDEALESDDFRVHQLDVFFDVGTEDPSGARVYLAAEGVMTWGRTAYANEGGIPDGRFVRTPADVRQGLFAAQIGREGERAHAVFEMGWASGGDPRDPNVEGRGGMHPDHVVGLILFPELLAFGTARAASLPQAQALGRLAPPGTRYAASRGGVTGATYLFPHATVPLAEWLELRLGWVWARATSDLVDPHRQRARGGDRNFQGGSPLPRDLGWEADAALRARWQRDRYELTGGIEGGVAVPGRAFDDGAGARLPPVGLVRFRAGARF